MRYKSHTLTKSSNVLFKHLL